MSQLLDELILERKPQALNYRGYLDRLVELTRKARRPETTGDYPPEINSSALRALYDNLQSQPQVVHEQPPGYTPADGSASRASIAVLLDRAIRATKRSDWRGNTMKEREVRFAIRSVLGEDSDQVDSIFEIVKNQHDY